MMPILGAALLDFLSREGTLKQTALSRAGALG
jgi:hypothetical protein